MTIVSLFISILICKNEMIEIQSMLCISIFVIANPNHNTANFLKIYRLQWAISMKTETRSPNTNIYPSIVQSNVYRHTDWPAYSSTTPLFEQQFFNNQILLFSERNLFLSKLSTNFFRISDPNFFWFYFSPFNYSFICLKNTLCFPIGHPPLCQFESSL